MTFIIGSHMFLTLKYPYDNQVFNNTYPSQLFLICHLVVNFTLSDIVRTHWVRPGLANKFILKVR